MAKASRQPLPLPPERKASCSLSFRRSKGQEQYQPEGICLSGIIDHIEKPLKCFALNNFSPLCA